MSEKIYQYPKFPSRCWQRRGGFRFPASISVRCFEKDVFLESSVVFMLLGLLFSFEDRAYKFPYSINDSVYSDTKY